MAVVELDGSHLRSEADVHRELARLLDFGPFYGHNLDALWDRLTTDVPRPVHLVWLHAEASRTAIGPSLDRVLKLLDDVVAWDERLDLDGGRFTYELA
ncbi:ribonuclease inhibitor [Lentzea fradiae]|uniref:Ribonuclease inhibitor n=1 Tax=Lentzea fradiae TaxID=200378 RepID=A0A1G7TTJ9_9PSEU|nr:barstar family protein [Lentzea fradiae]SDG38029.1 ribonuclease inhibitor [Lentzea fradiae]